MKILLIITVCKNNRSRVFNQIENLNKHKFILNQLNITPIFLTNIDDDLELKEYEVVKANIEDKYTNLYKKIFFSFENLQNREFDYLCKIDDDTIFNFKNFKHNILEGYDYIGRVANNFTGSHITIKFNMFMIDNKIDFYPSEFFKKPFKFCSGDCYFLSKKAVNMLYNKKEFLQNLKDDIVCEDQLVGYLLDGEDIKVNNIIESSKTIQDNSLQVTRDFLTIHPINERIFKNLILLDKEEQIKIIENSKFSNYNLRLAYLTKLQSKIKQEVINFYNENKLIGLG